MTVQNEFSIYTSMYSAQPQEMFFPLKKEHFVVLFHIVFKYKMCPSLVAKTCLHQKAVHSGSNATSGSHPNIIITAFKTAQSHLLIYLATIAAGAGPNICLA